jgi:hypothetical protein
MPQALQSLVQFVPFRPASFLSVLSYPSLVSFLTLRNKIHCRRHRKLARKCAGGDDPDASSSMLVQVALTSFSASMGFWSCKIAHEQ